MQYHELLQWFQTKYPNIVESMNNCSHHYSTENLNPYHIEGSVWTHTVMVYLNAVRDSDNIVLWLSALLHDIGKPLAATRNDENKRVKFTGHCSLSFYLAIDILNALREDGVINTTERNTVLNIIALHDELYNGPILVNKKFNEQKIKERFIGNSVLLDLLKKQTEYDSFGRFFIPAVDDKVTMKCFPKIDIEENMVTLEKNFNTLVVLIGPPCSGKSTYIKNLNIESNPDIVVVSRDNVMLEYANNNHIPGTYSEVWKYLVDNDLQQDIDQITYQQFDKALKDRKTIIIDMTNMSKKSRKKWLNGLPTSYKTGAVVLLTEYNEIMKRNKIRAQKNGKSIPTDVIHNMMKTFYLPLYNEFDFIIYND